MRSRSSFKTKVLLAFSASALVVIGLVTTTWKLRNDSVDAARWVSHTHDVLNHLARVGEAALQIELSTQSFRISGDPARLAERDAAISTRENLLRKLAQLVSDNTQQQQLLLELQRIINVRLEISRQVERLRETQGQPAANAFVATAPLRETRERMHSLLHTMEDEESRLLQKRTEEQMLIQQWVAIAGGTLTLLLIAQLAATYVFIQRQLQEAEVGRQALVESEESLSITLHSIGDGMLATDTHERITRMNPVAERLTGWSFAHARGRHVTEVFRIVHEETRAAVAIPIAKVLETGKVQELENHTTLISRDGTEYPIADSAAPIRDAQDNIIGVVLVFRDETVARQAQRTIHNQNEQLKRRVVERTVQLREAEDHLHSVMGNVPAMIAYVDAQQRYVYANRQYRERFTPEKSDLTNCTVREILGEERYSNVSPAIAKVLQGEPQSYDWEPFPGVWYAIHYRPKFDANDEVDGYYVMGSDITERKQAETKIQALNTTLEEHVRELEYVSRALRTLSAGNRTMLMATDEQGLLEGMCKAIVTTAGYHVASVWYRIDDTYKSVRAMAECGHPGGLSALQLMKGSWGDNAMGQGSVATAIRTGQVSVVHNILTDPAYAPWRPYLPGYACGAAFPLRVEDQIIGGLAIYAAETDAFGPDEVKLLTESADDLAFGIGTLRTRTEQEKTLEAMQHMTHYDALTGLPNETRFTELLASAIQGSESSAQPAPSFTVLQANVERLAEINDALGFNQGDKVLQEFSVRLRKAAPSSATIARLRGDEFAVMLPNSSAGDAICLVQELEHTLKRPFPIADIALDVSARVGVAQFPEHGNTVHDLLRHMDIALHQAKSKDVGHMVFDPGLSQDKSLRLAIAGELRHAISNGDLQLYLQPKINMRTRRVCGAEGLVRWKHAQRGLIPPGDFISLAEHTGLIKPLTEWVISAALRLNQKWAPVGDAIPIAVNLSARNLRDEDLLKDILRIQSELGVASGLLELEITESMVMDDAEFSLRVLHSLRSNGFALYIDDFGTGYSSLSYLQKLPVEYIKIDQSFVRNMTIDKDSAMIVRSTIDLAHDLGRKVVAEGVETQAHWDKLADFGCDIAQGYFIAKPMPAEDFPDWMLEYQHSAGS